MKLADVLLVGATLALIIIGVDQSIAYGFQNSYWAFMLALVPFFVFSYRRSQKATRDGDDQQVTAPKSSKKARKK